MVVKAGNCKSLLRNEDKDVKQQNCYTANNKQYNIMVYSPNQATYAG